MALEFVTTAESDEVVVHVNAEVPDDIFGGETLRSAKAAFKDQEIVHISLDADSGVTVKTKKKGGS